MFKYITLIGVLLSAQIAYAEQFPADANLVNVLDFWAVGDGVVDDTFAFQMAIGQCILRNQIIYIPNGRYKITQPLTWTRLVSVNGVLQKQWAGRCSVMGESRDGTVLFIPDGTPAFSNALKPNGMFIMSSDGTSGKPQVPTDPNAKPGGNAAPLNSGSEFTCELGNNPGAQCIDWVVSNRGSIRDVKIVGERCYSGIEATRNYPGPAEIERVEVQGCDYGIRLGNVQFNTTLSDIRLIGQRVAGIFTGPSGVAIEDLYSVNSVPAIRFDSQNGHLTAINLELLGGSPTVPAIDVKETAAAPSHFFLRNVVAGGYRSALRRGTTFVSGLILDEYSADPVRSLFFARERKSLNLPIERGPEPIRPDFAFWRKPTGPANQGGDMIDDRATIQDALNSGAMVVYLPHGNNGTGAQYWISGPLTVPCSVQRIIGMDNFLSPMSTYPKGQPAIQVSENCPEPLVIERLWAAGGQPSALGAHWIEHTSNRVLHVRDVQLGGRNLGVLTRPGAGNLFLSDVFGSVDLNGTKVWARQLNTEIFSFVQAGNTNEGADFWALGVKTEQDFPYLTQNGGRTEILGGFFMPGVGTGGSGFPVSTGFTLRNAQFSASYMLWSALPGDNWPVHVEETRTTIATRKLLGVDVPNVLSPNSRAWMSLYTTR